MADDKTRILTAEDVARLAALAESADGKTRVLSADEAARILAPPTAEPADDRTRVLTAKEAARLVASPPAPAVEGKTRMLSAEEAARILAAPEKQPTAATAPPRLVGDKIVFYCANGHRIAVDRGLAGKRGNCSKQGCGVPVVIPVLPGTEPPGESTPPGSDVAAAAAPEPAAEPEAAGAPFAADPAPASGFPVAPPAEAAAEGDLPAPVWDFVAGPPMDAAAEVGAEPDAAAAGWGIDAGEIDHPTARLVARLWIERTHGGVVEVHLSGGSVIMPEWYDARWSCGSHALFAALAADGTVTLTAVAWDQIQKVVVRHVQGTPDGMFEG